MQQFRYSKHIAVLAGEIPEFPILAPPGFKVAVHTSLGRMGLVSLKYLRVGRLLQRCAFLVGGAITPAGLIADKLWLVETRKEREDA